VFLLDVMGGAGAMWGCLEIGGYRVNYPKNCHEVITYKKADGSMATFEGINGAWGIQYENCGNTYSESRIICAFVFFLCCMSWQRLIPSVHWTEHTHPQSCCGLNMEFLCRTFLLEVMGGAGALWGFSEICGRSGASLRLGWGDKYFGQNSFDFWRGWSLAVFILCFVRWVMIRFIPGPPDGWNGYEKKQPPQSIEMFSQFDDKEINTMQFDNTEINTMQFDNKEINSVIIDRKL